MTNQISRLRSLPAEFDAVQFDGTEQRGGFIVGWVTAQGGHAEFVGAGSEHTLRRENEHDHSNGHVYSENAPAFVALEGMRRIDRGGWVIRDGERFSLCSSDDLADTFEVLSGPRTLKVHVVLEAVVCDRCDLYFGLPLIFDNKSFTCPAGHKNAPRKFEQEG